MATLDHTTMFPRSYVLSAQRKDDERRSDESIRPSSISTSPSCMDISWYSPHELSEQKDFFRPLGELPMLGVSFLLSQYEQYRCRRGLSCYHHISSIDAGELYGPLRAVKVPQHTVAMRLYVCGKSSCIKTQASGLHLVQSEPTFPGPKKGNWRWHHLKEFPCLKDKVSSSWSRESDVWRHPWTKLRCFAASALVWWTLRGHVPNWNCFARILSTFWW